MGGGVKHHPFSVKSLPAKALFPYVRPGVRAADFTSLCPS